MYVHLFLLFTVVYAVNYFHLNTVTYDHIRFIMCIALKPIFATYGQMCIHFLL